MKLHRTRSQIAALVQGIAMREAELQQAWQYGLDVMTAPDYPHLLRTIVGRTRALLGADASALCTLQRGTSTSTEGWAVQAACGAPEAFDTAIYRLPRQVGGLSGSCPVVCSPYRLSHLRLSIIRNGVALGCLCVACRQDRTFSTHERGLLTGLAVQAGAALRRMQDKEHECGNAVAAERERLAREMHDTLAQLIGFAGFKTKAVQELLAQGQIEAAQGQLKTLGSLSQALYADARELILGLHAEPGQARALVPALTAYAERFGEWSGIATTVVAEGFDGVLLRPAVELQLVRVVQEGLSNARKHAQAQNIRIAINRDDEWAVVSVADDGRGFECAARAAGGVMQFGLQSMRDRIAAVGGSLAIQSTPGRGTMVTARVPLVYREGEMS
jgi:signal transduction histidine kinase